MLDQCDGFEIAGQIIAFKAGFNLLVLPSEAELEGVARARIGDRAIATFSGLISDTIRTTYLAGRIGGQEFCVPVWDCNTPQALGLAERLRLALAQREHEGIGNDVRLTASFGVTAVHRGEGYARAFSRADAALYAAKQAGRNQVVIDGDVASIRQPELVASEPPALARIACAGKAQPGP